MTKFNKKFLVSIGLDVAKHEDIINKILECHNGVTCELERQNEKSKNYENYEKENAELRVQLEVANNRADLAEKAVIDRNAEIETERVNGVLLEKIHAVAIKEGKLDGLGVKALRKHVLDMSIVKHVDGEISNLDEILRLYKEDEVIGDLWGGESLVEGANAGYFAVGDVKGLSLEMIKSMTPEQIYENWDAVSRVLEGF